jgi:hypothetical protein
MELFLNLCWLSLVLPAYLLWRQRTFASSKNKRATQSPLPPLIFLCVLGCALVLLFPVISASDDLHAMRAEMEESSPCKRSVCQSGGEKASVWHSRWQSPCVVIAIDSSLGLTDQARQESLTVLHFLPAAPSLLPASRAPPPSVVG